MVQKGRSNKTNRLLKAVKGQAFEPKSPLAGNFFIPNHSGEHKDLVVKQLANFYHEVRIWGTNTVGGRGSIRMFDNGTFFVHKDRDTSQFMLMEWNPTDDNGVIRSTKDIKLEPGANKVVFLNTAVDFMPSAPMGPFNNKIGSAALRFDSIFSKNIDLSAKLTLGFITQGSVLFGGASGVISQDNFNLFWDDANKRLEPNLIKITSDGTQASPALKFNDTNTGFFKSGDSIRTSINNSTIMTVDGTGVGIGTVTPTIPLDVKAKSGMSAIGGFCVKLTNKTGANPVCSYSCDIIIK